MERLKLNVYIVCGLLLATAAWSQYSPKPEKIAGKTEAWLEEVAPKTVGDFSFLPDRSQPDSDPLCSYKDPKEVYDSLAPTIGILARVYQSGAQAFDTTLIASRDRVSFHDPRVCFTAQGWVIGDEQQITIPTQTRQEIPATMVQLTGPDGKPGIAVYFYKGPRGYYGSTTRFKIALLMDQLKGRADLDGIFYRFIPMAMLDKDQVTQADKDRLIQFISQYMDEAGQKSGGYF